MRELKGISRELLKSANDAKKGILKDVKLFFQNSGVEIDDAEIKESYLIFSEECIVDPASERIDHVKPDSSPNRSINGVPLKNEDLIPPLHTHANLKSRCRPHSVKNPVKERPKHVQKDANRYVLKKRRTRLPSIHIGDLMIEEPSFMDPVAGRELGAGISLSEPGLKTLTDHTHGPNCDCPVWIAIPHLGIFGSPTEIEHVSESLKQQGTTDEEIHEFWKQASPAFFVPHDLSLNDDGTEPANEHERAVNMVLRLGFLGPVSSIPPTEIEKFRAHFRHGVDVWYPVGMYRSFISLYCDYSTEGLLVWNHSVKAFLHDLSLVPSDWLDELPILDSAPHMRRVIKADSSRSPKDRANTIRDYFAHFGIKYLDPGPRIQTQLNGRSSFLYIMGNVPGSRFDKTMDLESLSITRNMVKIFDGLDIPNYSMADLRDIFFLSNVIGLSEQSKGLTYHHGSSHEGLEDTLRSRIRGGISEFLHIRNTLRPGLYTYFSSRGVAILLGSMTFLEAGRTYTNIFSSRSGITSIFPDNVLWLQVPKVHYVGGHITFAPNDIAAYSEEISTSNDPSKLDTDLRTLFLGLISITRMASIDSKSVDGKPEDQVRSGIYRGTTIRGLQGTAYLKGLKKLLRGTKIVGIRSDSTWLQVEKNFSGDVVNGIKGTARIDDGDGSHQPCHIKFEITRDSQYKSRFWLKAAIGAFQLLPIDGSTPEYSKASFVPGSIWYNSAEKATSIDVDILKDHLNNPLKEKYIDVEARELSRWAMSQFRQNGFIDREDWQYIRANDASFLKEVMGNYHPWLFDPVWQTCGTGITYAGELNSRFRASVAANIPGALLTPEMLRPRAARWRDVWGKGAYEETLRYLKSTFGMERQTIECPGVSGISETKVKLKVLGTRKAVNTLQRKIDEDFQCSRITAPLITEAIIGNAPWEDMANIISDSNVRIEARGSNVWNSRRHLEKITYYIKNLLNVVRIALGSRGSDIEISHPGVQQFLKSLNTYDEGRLFPSSATLATDTRQNDILYEWLQMWKTIIEGHGIIVPWERPEQELRNSLNGHIQHAIIHDWAIGNSQAKGQSILRNFYVGNRLPTNVQLALLAADSGFGVTFAITNTDDYIKIGGWNYAKVRFQPLRSQKAVEFIVRYRPYSELNDPKGSSFEAYAVCANPTADPNQRIYAVSGPSVSDLWDIILAGKVPQQFDGSLRLYLDSFNRVQVGGLPGRDCPIAVPILQDLGPKK